MNRRNKGKRWAEGYADPHKTSLVIREKLNGPDALDVDTVKWFFLMGLAQKHWLRVPFRTCNSCLFCVDDAPEEYCRTPGVHTDRSIVRYTRMKTGKRTYNIEADGTAPTGIYDRETRKEKNERLSREIKTMIEAQKEAEIA